MGAVIWLASYPKSGNTWTRALLAGHDEAGALDLNRIGHAGHPENERADELARAGMATGVARREIEGQESIHSCLIPEF